MQVQLGEAREGCEFLQAERATLAEAQLESEAEMRRLRGLLEAALETSRVLYQRCAKLFAKCQQKRYLSSPPSLRFFSICIPESRNYCTLPTLTEDVVVHFP